MTTRDEGLRGPAAVTAPGGPPGATPSARGQLQGIQCLRALAAVMVVVHHTRDPEPWLFNPFSGYQALAWGVDIFFVISGFIMVVAASHERPREFAAKRVIRIVPLYWIATFTTVALMLGTGVGGPVRPLDLLRSLTFVPYPNAVDPTQAWPILVPGWTLNYEMLFYLLFFLGLCVRRPIAVAGTSVVALVVVGHLTGRHGTVGRAETSWMMLEFAVGMVLGHLHRTGRLPRLPFLVPVGIAAILATPLLPLADQPVARIAAATITVVGATGIRSTPWRFALLLGDASFSIYLTHMAGVVEVCSVVVRALPLHGWAQLATFSLLATVASIAAGVVVHLVLEKPLTQWLRARWVALTRRTPAPA